MLILIVSHMSDLIYGLIDHPAQMHSNFISESGRISRRYILIITKIDGHYIHIRKFLLYATFQGFQFRLFVTFEKHALLLSRNINQVPYICYHMVLSTINGQRSQLNFLFGRRYAV